MAHLGTFDTVNKAARRMRELEGYSGGDDGGLQADGEESFNGTCGNDEEAPIAAVLTIMI